MFYDPSAMLAFVRFNFLLRRTLIELMHADLIFIRSESIIWRAQAHGRWTATLPIDTSEPIARVRQLADEWKQPFQREYTERSVNQAFEKLLALRTDVDRALEKGNRQTRNSGDKIRGETQRNKNKRCNGCAMHAHQKGQPFRSASRGQVVPELDFGAAWSRFGNS